MKNLMDLFIKNIRKSNKTFYFATLSVFYLCLVKYKRYATIRMIQKKYPNPEDVLNDTKIAEEIFSITTKKEFPYISRKATELALFKTYAIPSISKILCATGEFEKDCPRRVDDTEFILGEITDTFGRIQKQLIKDPNTPMEDIEEQYKRPELAIKRLNELHGKYRILNGDFVYTLSLFIVEPIQWINRYEWRKLDEREVNAMFRVWYDVGVKMNIKDIPDTPAKMIEFSKAYCEKYSQYSYTNFVCGEPTVRLLLSNLPKMLQESVYRFSLTFLPSVLDKQDSESFKLPKENKLYTFFFKSTLWLRALLIRHLFLPRSNWVNRTPFYANEKGRYIPEFNIYPPVYPEGYKIPELGPKRHLPQHEVPMAMPMLCPVKR